MTIFIHHILCPCLSTWPSLSKKHDTLSRRDVGQSTWEYLYNLSGSSEMITSSRMLKFSCNIASCGSTTFTSFVRNIPCKSILAVFHFFLYPLFAATKNLLLCDGPSDLSNTSFSKHCNFHEMVKAPQKCMQDLHRKCCSFTDIIIIFLFGNSSTFLNQEKFGVIWEYLY